MIERDGKFYITRLSVDTNNAAAAFVKRYAHMLVYDVYLQAWVL